MPNQVIVVIDVPPREAPHWVGATFQQADLHVADLEKISAMVRQDPTAREILLADYMQPDVQERVAPYYQSAFQTLYANQARMGIYGVAWLQFLPRVDAFIVDFSRLGRPTSKATKSLTPEEIRQVQEFEITVGRAFVQQRTSVLPPERVLEVSGGEDEYAAQEQSLAFLRNLGLVTAG